MEEERYSNPNPNPSSQNKPPAPTILLDRFQAMLRERDDEMRNLNPTQSPPPLDLSEVVTFYDLLLRELTFNSKPIITELTILAGNHRPFAEGIADAICTRISEVTPDQKLPSLYLLDSIVKNIGGEYIRPFTARLPEVFIGAYTRVHPSQHPAMRHLFKTWSQVFPSSVLRKIEDALQFNSPSSSGAAHQQQQVGGPVRKGPTDSPVASPHPSRIHVNPKYLEAPHHLKGSAVTQSMGPVDHKNISNYETERLEHAPESPRGWSSMSPSQHYEGEYDHGEVLPPRVRSRVSTHPTAFTQDVPLPFPSRRTNILPLKPPSPARIGIRRSRSPPADLYTDRPSTSHIFRNGYRSQNPNPRELIDAYGGDNRKAQRLENGREWKRSEEEEFVWEDMSPTFADREKNRRDQRERMGIYGTGPGLIGSRVGLDRPDPRPIDPSYRRSWPTLGRLGPNDDRAYLLEDRRPVSTVHFADTAAYKKHEASISSHPDALLYHHQNSNHVREPKLPPYNGPTITQANHSVPHHVRPSHNPAIITRVMPPPLNAPLRSSVGQLENASANSLRPLQPKTDYIRSAADTSDANKPSLFTPSVSAGTMPLPVPVTMAGHMPAQQPIMIMHTQGLATPPVTASLMPPAAGLPQLLQPQLPAGVVNAPLPGSIGMMPPLPPGPPPSSIHSKPLSFPTGHTQLSGAAPAFTGLLSTLMAQGLISLKPEQAPPQDALVFEFNLDTLKVRNESAINALYSDLPRQCTTCGVRFRNQEVHSAHMDWHVTKNRVARNRKQKSSRKWYVSATEWLRGAGAENVGTEAIPVIPAVETEQEEEVEAAVPADENQTVCALCGELFEDFYSDETEEWMYKGAVYMNGTDGSDAGTGPIVHAKCRSESTST